MFVGAPKRAELRVMMAFVVPCPFSQVRLIANLRIHEFKNPIPF
jgi:hypothetical protein